MFVFLVTHITEWFEHLQSRHQQLCLPIYLSTVHVHAQYIYRNQSHLYLEIL